MLFTPIGAKASFLSSILGNEVSADTVESISSAEIVNNSQTIALLQADVSSASFLEEKTAEIKESISTNIVSENALLATASPMSLSSGLMEDSIPFSDQMSVYVVRKGDSISQIAEMFGVSVNTILWANDMKKNDKLSPDDLLFILPISGLEHTITKGQTLNSIAKLYKADISDIARFNGITEETKLNIGDKIIVPGGEIYVDGPTTTQKTTSVNKTYPKTSVKNLAGYFINPVPGYVKTQGLHGKNAVDLAAPIGTPIYAAASGTVLLARTGWNGAYGNMVIIQHPNGTKTLYSHLSKLGSKTGQAVKQGEIIGYVGNTGRVRPSKGGNGAHLHFEVYNAKNPGVDGSWKY
ncbi:MAG: Peptidase M23 family protein [Candidatus Nomurabacteria bacterium GW2011_GWE1_32_28]|uniref:Peptidase M23 family protein n=1 Tax=Candidatus Nomurabacteria bacterium GW2011_GWF1_31_48 TaxID=1618767 RepID=A0A0F9YFA5_9BACT|nr:MAG: Peptidase M23 family protein [Candidatus Nomurabacteria bacterium GW2011_GWF2_30_133]KKP28811.1 MAG: Peptidase M23 family protein [Candidatus Nomurabacteria bacterium GW2011_GWE2_31_40]KKP30389.1 MAG: Peptidase M23 family protein [Candidatus Nomurabacteria bacterium GW2011_GWF1_31_48]KKP34916.1 MAG: Peptidase M23 family protein [Candidatus Nomurabacteria bacterium GW2011_GWE1_32_28]HAS81007.1 hypothetical protein [Candidatus Nomurabacteria bacterium]